MYGECLDNVRALILISWYCLISRRCNGKYVNNKESIRLTAGLGLIDPAY